MWLEHLNSFLEKARRGCGFQERKFPPPASNVSGLYLVSRPHLLVQSGQIAQAFVFTAPEVFLCVIRDCSDTAHDGAPKWARLRGPREPKGALPRGSEVSRAWALGGTYPGTDVKGTDIQV